MFGETCVSTNTKQILDNLILQEFYKFLKIEKTRLGYENNYFVYFLYLTFVTLNSLQIL